MSLTNISSPPSTGLLESVFSETGVHISHRLQTERLDLLAISSADLESYKALLADPSVMKLVGLEAGETLSSDEAKSVVDGAVNAWSARGYGRWSMFDRETGEFIGFCGFRAEQGVPELICMMHEPFWGCSLAAEAAKACLEHGFKTLGFTEVKAFCRPEHSRARRTLDKLDAEFLRYTDFHGVEGAEYLISPHLLMS